MKTIAQNRHWEIKQYDDVPNTNSYWLYWMGYPQKHLTASELISLRELLNVPILLEERCEAEEHSKDL